MWLLRVKSEVYVRVWEANRKKSNLLEGRDEEDKIIKQNLEKVGFGTE